MERQRSSLLAFTGRRRELELASSTPSSPLFDAWLFWVFAANRKTRWPESQNRRPPLRAGGVGGVGGSNPQPLGSSICLALELTLPSCLLLAFVRWLSKTLVGDLGQLPHTFVSVWTNGRHGRTRGGDHLQGPEEDASRWPRNLSPLWGPMIEAGNVLGGTRRTRRRGRHRNESHSSPRTNPNAGYTDQRWKRKYCTKLYLLTLPSLCGFCCFLIRSALSTFNFSYILLLWIIKTDDSQIMKD